MIIKDKESETRAHSLSTVLTIVFPIFLFLNSIYSSPAAAQPACVQFYSRSTLYDKANPENNLLAIHLTDYFPSDGYVRASAANLGRFLVTLHFSLGQTVNDHESGNWSKRKYAVALPLSAMRDQVLNLFPQDTFVLGDVKLPPDAIVFAPSNESLPSSIKQKIIYYDPTHGVKQAVSEYIKQSGTLMLTAKTGQTEESHIIDGKNINELQGSKDFFPNFFKDKPYITNQLHATSSWGIVDGHVANSVGYWLRSGRPFRKGTTNDYLLELIGIHDAKVDSLSLSKQMKLPAHATQSLKEGLDALSNYTSLMKVEIEARRSLKRTVVGTDLTQNPTLHRELINALGSKALLQKIVEKNKDTLEAITHDYDQLSPEVVASYIKFADFESFDRMMKNIFPNPTPTQAKDISSSLIQYAIRLLFEGRMTSQRCVDIWNRHVENSENLPWRLNPYIQQITNSRFQKATPTVIEFFQNPGVRLHLKDLIDAFREDYENDPQNRKHFESIFGA